MTEDELKTISNNIKEKLGDESFAMIGDDLGQIITGREMMEKDIKARDSEISDLQEIMAESYQKTHKKQFKLLASPQATPFIEKNLVELKKLV